MESLGQLMREATDLAPAPARLDNGAVAESWRRGRRRRAGRVVAVGVCAVTSVLLVVAVLLGAQGLALARVLPADGGDTNSTGARGYPQRIGHQLLVTDLPDRPGPMAGLLQVRDSDEQSGDELSWQAVSPSGRRYSLPFVEGNMSETYPVISADGRRIAYYQSSFDRMIVRDLVSGVTWLPNVGGPSRSGPDGGFTSRREHQLAMQSPGWFTPNNRFLALPTEDGPVVWDLRDGGGRVVPTMAQAAGWLDDDTLIGRTVGATDRSAGDSGVEVVAWNRSSGQTASLGRVEFIRPPVDGAFLDGQWWGQVRGDGTLWVALVGESDDIRRITGVSLPGLDPVDLAGATVPELRWNELQYDPVGRVPLAWQGTTPVGVSSLFADRSVRPQLVDRSMRTVTALESSVDIDNVLWAEDALAGDPSFSIFGTSTAWWTWWWKELALAAGALGALIWWRRRRRTRVAK